MEDILWQDAWTYAFENQHNSSNSWDKDSKNLGQCSHTQDSDIKLFKYMALFQESLKSSKY